MILRLLTIFVVFWLSDSYGIQKVRIFTYHCDKPNFIELQNKLFKKFFPFAYEWLVFNDATDKILRKKIKTTCNQLKIKCINVPPKIHTDWALQRNFKRVARLYKKHSLFDWTIAGDIKKLLVLVTNTTLRHQSVIQYSLNKFGYHYRGIIAIMDGDIFPIKSFNVHTYLSNNHILGSMHPALYDHSISYLDTPIMFINMKTLPRKYHFGFSSCFINGKLTDTGGQLWYYVKENPQTKLKLLPILTTTSSQTPVSIITIFKHYDQRITPFELRLNESFLHFRATSWLHYVIDKQRAHSIVTYKEQLLTEALNHILKAT